MMSADSVALIVFGLIVGVAILRNVLVGDFQWGWPGGLVQRAKQPRAFWSFNAFLALIGTYCFVEAIRQL